MQCVIHGSEEAVDACRTCGKPLCALCGSDSGGSYVCARCRLSRTASGPEPATPPAGSAGPGTADPLDPQATAAADADAASAAPGRRSPALAALLSFLPGLGQLYNGEPLKFLAFLSIFLLLALASVRLGTIGVFAAFFWFYQVFEAFHTALRDGSPEAEREAAPGTATPWTAWLLIGLGLAALLQNLTGAVLPHRQYVIPALIILAGLRLLFSYFRAPDEAHS